LALGAQRGVQQVPLGLLDAQNDKAIILVLVEYVGRNLNALGRSHTTLAVDNYTMGHADFLPSCYQSPWMVAPPSTTIA